MCPPLVRFANWSAVEADGPLACRGPDRGALDGTACRRTSVVPADIGGDDWIVRISTQRWGLAGDRPATFVVTSRPMLGPTWGPFEPNST